MVLPGYGCGCWMAVSVELMFTGEIKRKGDSKKELILLPAGGKGRNWIEKTRYNGDNNQF